VTPMYHKPDLRGLQMEKRKLFESDKETIWKILNGQTCQSCRDADNDHCDPWCFKKNDHVPRAGVFGCWKEEK